MSADLDKFETFLKARVRVLEHIVEGGSIFDTLDILCRDTEDIDPAMRCSVLFFDQDANCLRHAAAPSLPDFYINAIDGLPAGLGVGSCGTAAHTGERVIVEDVYSHPYWEAYRDLARKTGFYACWSQPIYSKRKVVLGTFALYFDEVRQPTEEELQLIQAQATLVSIVIERKQDEDTLRDSEARLRNILYYSPTPIYLKDTDGRFLEANSQYEKNYGVKLADIYGKTSTEIFQDEYGKQFYDHDMAVLKSHEASVREEQIGDSTFVTSKFPILADDGTIIGLGGVETDITEHKKTEEKLISANEKSKKINEELNDRTMELTAEVTKRQLMELALIEAKSVAEQANLAKSEFLANMSHELRTPLNSIIGFSQMLEAETFGPLGSVQNKEYAEIIHHSGNHLLKIIGDILDLSKIEAGEDVLCEEDVTVSVVVEECLDMMSNRATSKRLSLASYIEADLPLLHADRLKVKQILLNLTSNAIKFTPEGGVVTAELLINKKRSIQIKVSDTGNGIAPEDLKKVMEPFGQVGDTYTRSHEGSGLGLALVKSQMAMHGGTVDLESTLGKGTTVIVTFPPERTMGS